MFKVLANTQDMPYEEWLECRKYGIGGSDVSVVCGINKYKSPIQLWMEKTDQLQQEEAGEAAYWGTQLESLVKSEFTKRTGIEVVSRKELLQSVENPFMLANLDGICEHPDLGTCVFEVKTASAYKSGEIYNKAAKLVEDKKYDEAIKILEKFDKYKESEEKLNEISELKKKEKYDKAVKLGEDEKYDEAIKLFEELGDYSDSKDKIAEMKKKRDADTYEMKGTVAWVKIDNGYLNIRVSAKSDAKSVGKLYNGDEVTIQATSSDKKWYKVTSGSITGYCSVDYITTSAVDQFLGSWSTGKSGWEISKIDSMTVAITGSIIDGAASIYKYEMTGSYNDGAIYFYGTETDTDYRLGMSSPSIITTDISGTLIIYGDTLHCNFSDGGGYTLTRSN